VFCQLAKICQCACTEIGLQLVDFPEFYIVAPEITEENFEDLLACDDVFLDYFNTFLTLPVSLLSYCLVLVTFKQMQMFSWFWFSG